jgi:hypothetical protein
MNGVRSASPPLFTPVAAAGQHLDHAPAIEIRHDSRELTTKAAAPFLPRDTFVTGDRDRRGTWWPPVRSS